jgi:hypothetical protein
MACGVCKRWNLGRVVAQAVSCRLLTETNQVRDRIRSCGICGGRNGTEEVSSECFGFPCQSSHQLRHTHHASSGAHITGQPNDGQHAKWTQSRLIPEGEVV